MGIFAAGATLVGLGIAVLAILSCENVRPKQRALRSVAGLAVFMLGVLNL